MRHLCHEQVAYSLANATMKRRLGAEQMRINLPALKQMLVDLKVVGPKYILYDMYKPLSLT